MRQPRKQMGFSLIEIMITLTLGLILSGALIQIMVSNSVTEKLNRAMASAQEGGRFVISRLRSDILMTGRYETLDPTLNGDVDIVTEEAFVQNHPVPLPGDIVGNAALGAVEGAGAASDVLVVGMQNTQDCAGNTHGYDAVNNESFYVVNEYFLTGTKLQCRGYDGRVLRALKAPIGATTSVTLLDDVTSFQVAYGVTDPALTNDNSGRPTEYVTANQLNAQIDAGAQVVAVRLSLLIRGEGEITIDSEQRFKLLDEAVITPPKDALYKQFETTITFRNMKNVMRSRKL